MVQQILAPPPERRKALAHRCLDEGLALYARGSTREALRLYLRAIDLEPDNALAHYVAGVALQAAGRVDEARSQWQSAAAVPSEGDDAQWAQDKARAMLRSPVDLDTEI